MCIKFDKIRLGILLCIMYLKRINTYVIKYEMRNAFYSKELPTSGVCCYNYASNYVVTTITMSWRFALLQIRNAICKKYTVHSTTLL